MLRKIQNKITQIPTKVFWIVSLSIGLLIFIFNDTVGNTPALGILAFLYLLLMLFLFLRWCFNQLRIILRLKHEKQKTELQHLKNQVHPHFFFNTLNNLYGTLEKESPARAMVLQLSDMMRYSIYEGQKEYVCLEDEIKYIQDYIDLQKGRYHRNIDLQFHCDISDPKLQIMPLLFIILVENAFKHGIETLADKAYIHMSLWADSKVLQFKIINNYGTSEQSEASGIGLKNLKRRLQLAYPKKHSLIFDTNSHTYSVNLELNLL